jgi:hypothetical protein
MKQDFDIAMDAIKKIQEAIQDVRVLLERHPDNLRDRGESFDLSAALAHLEHWIETRVELKK